MTDRPIPAGAVEAATKAFRETHFMDDALMNALKAAAPHMINSNEGEEMLDNRENLAALLADAIYRYTGVSTSYSKDIADEVMDAGWVRSCCCGKCAL